MTAFLSWTSLLITLLFVYAFPTWHIRWLGSLIYYFFLRRFAWSPEPDRLFSPIIMTSRCSPFDYDINGHKSNSTYFLNADISVGELIPRLASKSFHLRRKANKSIFPRLGAVGGIFLKEIRLFQSYRLSARVVAWDSKWVYAVTKFSSHSTGDNNKKETIFAIILSKVVFKQGRETIPPQVVFEESDLLPTSDNGCPPEMSSGMPRDGNHLAKVPNSEKVMETSWSREKFEETRKRGLTYVKEVLNIDSLRSLESEPSALQSKLMHSLW